MNKVKLFAHNKLWKGVNAMSKNSKDKLIQKEGPFSQSKVKQYMEKQSNDINTNIVSRGKDITYNKQ